MTRRFARSHVAEATGGGRTRPGYHPGMVVCPVASLSTRSLRWVLLLTCVVAMGCGTSSGGDGPGEPAATGATGRFEGPALLVPEGGFSNTGTAYVVGFEFHCSYWTEVTHLGVLDAHRDGSLDATTPPDVGLWTWDGVLLAEASVPIGTIAEEGWFHAPIEPVLLPPGYYVLGSLSAADEGERFVWSKAASWHAPGITVLQGRAVQSEHLAFPQGILLPSPGGYFGPGCKVRIDDLPPLVLDAPRMNQVFQRDVADHAPVRVSGVLTAPVDRIEARAVARAGHRGTSTAWTVLDAAPQVGRFAHAVPVATGWYDVRVRALRGAEVVHEVVVERVGVGEVFITAGQSNAANHGTPPLRAADERVTTLNLWTGAWEPAHDPQPFATGRGGSPWPALGDLLAAEHDLPVAIIAVGVGSTTVQNWHDFHGVLDHFWRLRMAGDRLRDSGYRAVLWHQGESDSLAGTSTATYATGLNNVITRYRNSVAGAAVPWFVAHASYHPGASSMAEDMVRAGQDLVVGGSADTYAGPDTDGFHLAVPSHMASDGVHFNEVGLRAHAAAWQVALRALLPAP